MTNATPIEKCFIGADGQYDVEAAAKNGWSNFAVFPNGRLIGTSPTGETEVPVPEYHRMLIAAAPKLLAALKQCRAELETFGFENPELNALIERAEGKSK